MVSTFSILFLVCIFQGSFGICSKKYQPLSWEASWVLFSFIGVLCIPHIWCMVEVPRYLGYITATPVPTLIVGAPPGFFWGIGFIRYNKAIDMIGVSLVASINLGLSNLLGSFVPMIIPGTYPSAHALVVLLLGQLILLGGVIVSLKAGSMKNGNNEGTKTAKEKGMSPLLITGLIMAPAFGTSSVVINTGATTTNCPVALAAKKGVSPASVSLLSWVVVFAGGFLANFVYAISRLIKNKTHTGYTKPGCIKAYFKAVLTSIVWFGTLAIYGKAIALLGTSGPMVGWVTLNGLALIITNAWGFLDEEQKGFEKAKRVVMYGNVVIIATLMVVGISNGL